MKTKVEYYGIKSRIMLLISTVSIICCTTRILNYANTFYAITIFMQLQNAINLRSVHKNWATNRYLWFCSPTRFFKFFFLWWDRFWFLWFISRMVHYYSYRELNFRIRFQLVLVRKFKILRSSLILDFYSIQRTTSKSNLDDSEWFRNPEISKEEIS